MNFEWISREEYLVFLEKLHKYTGKTNQTISSEKRYGRRFIDNFSSKYPRSTDWWQMNADDREWVHVRLSDKYLNLNKEILYVIHWAWTRQLCVGNDEQARKHQLILANYFHSRPNFQFYVDIAMFYGLLSEEELKVIQKNGVKLDRWIARHMLVLMKPLKDITDDDFHVIKHLGLRHYSSKSLQDVRIKLGYSQRPQKKLKISALMKAKSHPKWGEMAKQYEAYLLRGNARERYIQFNGQMLCRLFMYLEDRNFADCSKFDYEQYLDFFDFISEGKRVEKLKKTTTHSYLAAFKNFMEWGVGSNSFFPFKFDFPISEYRRNIKLGFEESISGDGLAFKDPTFPDQLVQAIVDYKPINDIDSIARWFWMIVVSCPARYSFVLYLDADEPMLPMPNSPNAWGLYSKSADKAGNRRGQFPIIDPMGIEAVRALQQRAKKLNLTPLENPYSKTTYVHLFQLPDAPWLAYRQLFIDFFNKVKTTIPDGREKKGSAHSFRHLLLTHIAVKTGNLHLVQLAAGHKSPSMTKLYLRSTVSRDALLWALLKKYEQRELSGRFYFRIFELLAEEKIGNDKVLQALAGNMYTLNEFLEKYGLPSPTGYGTCLVQGDCEHEKKCYGCSHFLMLKSDVQFAVKFLAKLMYAMQRMIVGSRDFSYENSKASGLMTNIALLMNQIQNFGFTDEQMDGMICAELKTLFLGDGI